MGWALRCSCYCCSFSSLLFCPACPIGSDNTPAEAEKRSVFVIVTVFVPCVLPLSCLCFSTLGKEKNKHFLLSALLSPCQAPEVLLGFSWGHTRCLLGEAPQVPASVTGWGFLKGRVGRRAVEGRGMFTLVEGGGFHAASAVMLDVHPPGLPWTGMVVDRMDGLLWEWSKFKF